MQVYKMIITFHAISPETAKALQGLAQEYLNDAEAWLPVQYVTVLDPEEVP